VESNYRTEKRFLTKGSPIVMAGPRENPPFLAQETNVRFSQQLSFRVAKVDIGSSTTGCARMS
jgi:hypothetical protein